MSEEKQVKKQLLKNMVLNLITFTILFYLLGLVIYTQFKENLYTSADSELTNFIMRRNLKTSDFSNLDPNSKDEKKVFNESSPSDVNTSDSINENPPVAPKEDSPRLIIINRDKDGNIIENDNLNEIFSDITFDVNNLNSIYDISVDGYSYRGINYKDENGTYKQALINVDSEKQIAHQFITNLVITFSLSVIAITIVSYFLSKKTLEPIITSWKKQNEFVENASHELRTPITIIKAKQEMLLEKPNEKIIDNAEEISITLKETQRLIKLINELMEIAKNDNDKIKLNKQSFSIDNEIKELMILYEDVAKIDNKTLTCNLNFSENIYADLNKIKELLVILLDNSLKYTSSGDSINISTYKKDNKCVIEIEDTGIGISNEAIDHVFERFYREEKSRNSEKGGMGLGLSIAYGIVTLHKGSIKYEKNRVKGTKVIVKLPIN